MNYKSTALRLFAIFFGILMGLGAIMVIRQRIQKSNQPDSPFPQAERQAAKFVYYKLPFYFPYKERSTFTYGTEAFTKDPEFGYPHNSQGFRSPEYTTAHPPRTFRILVLGDSFTWGEGVPIQDTFSFVTQKLLQQRCPSIGIETIALGVRGHRFADNYIKLLVHGEALKPDLVIFQMCTNDLDFYQYASILSFQGNTDIPDAYRARQFQIFNPGSLDWRIFEETVDKLKAWSKTHSTPVVFIVFPLLDLKERGHNFAHYDMQKFGNLPEFSSFLNVVAELQKNFPTLYLLQTYRERGGDHHLTVSETNGHPNAFAHHLAGESLTSFLEEKRLTACSLPLKTEDVEWSKELDLRQTAVEHWSDFNQSYTKQLSFFRKLLELHPRNEWITAQLANVYLGMEKWNDAYRAFESLTNLSQFAAPWYQMALCINDENRKKELLERTLQATPDHTDAMKDLASIDLGQNDKKSACELLLRLTQIPDSKEQFEQSKQLIDQVDCGKF